MVVWNCKAWQTYGSPRPTKDDKSVIIEGKSVSFFPRSRYSRSACNLPRQRCNRVCDACLDVMHILFLDPLTQSSKRERELRDAAARSHAAKISHRERGLRDVAARSHAARISHHHAKKTFKARTSWSAPADFNNAGARRVKPLEFDVPESLGLIPAASPYTGFGSFRSELLDLLPSEARAGDSLALDFFVQFTLPGIDVASEMFNNSGAFHFLLPNLVSLPLYRLSLGRMDAIRKLVFFPHSQP